MDLALFGESDGRATGDGRLICRSRRIRLFLCVSFFCFGCRAESQKSSLSPSDVRRAMRIEAKRLEGEKVLCMRKQGFKYTEQENSVDLPGLFLLDVSEREAFVSLSGYGFVAFLRNRKVPTDGDDPAAFTSAQISCEKQLPRPRLVLGEVQTRTFDSELTAAMSSHKWREYESQWAMCMTEAGFPKMSPSRSAPLEFLSRRTAEVSNGEPPTQSQLVQIFSVELQLAKADHVCRLTSLDLIEPAEVFRLQTKMLEDDPKILTVAQEILEANEVEE
jgi:hypothetical protein